MQFKRSVGFKSNRAEPVDKCDGIAFDAALPDHDHAPSLIEQSSLDVMVARLIGGELRLPEFLPCPGSSRETATGVTVPEATVHEDACAVFR